ncbi:hypothetical protein GCM10022376_01110 [Yimella lutea]
MAERRADGRGGVRARDRADERALEQTLFLHLTGFFQIKQETLAIQAPVAGVVDADDRVIVRDDRQLPDDGLHYTVLHDVWTLEQPRM